MDFHPTSDGPEAPLILALDRCGRRPSAREFPASADERTERDNRRAERRKPSDHGARTL